MTRLQIEFHNNSKAEQCDQTFKKENCPILEKVAKTIVQPKISQNIYNKADA
jgi:hypothetical protein